MSKFGEALDRYITGDYGERQFRGMGRNYTRSFFAGQKARRAGKPIDSCKCRSKVTRQEWKSGWADEDMCIGRGEGS